jgi:hypothetical protein
MATDDEVEVQRGTSHKLIIKACPSATHRTSELSSHTVQLFSLMYQGNAI